MRPDIQHPRTWPRQFLSDFDRIGPALWFFIYLLTRMNPQTGCLRVSFKVVAQDLGVSTVKIKKWLDQLEQAGYLHDESLDGKMIVRLEFRVP